NFNTTNNPSGTIYDQNNTSVTGGSTLSLKTDSGGTEFLSDSMTLNNGTFQVTGGYYFLDYQGTLTLGSGGGTFNVAANTEAIWSGSIGGTGSLTASGPGTLTLLSSGNPMTMTYTGGTLIESGSTLKLGQNNLGVDYLGPGAVTLNGGTLKEAGALLSLT